MSQPSILLPRETKSQCSGKDRRIDQLTHLCLHFYWSNFFQEMNKAGQMIFEHFPA